jgi:hypothetical protein
VIVLNKTDLLPEPASLDWEDERVVGVVAASAVTGAGIDELRRTLFETLPQTALPAAAQETDEELADYLVYRPQPPRRRGIRILRGDGRYHVAEAAAASVGDEALYEALRAAGARPGDEVTVGDRTFELE